MMKCKRRGREEELVIKEETKEQDSKFGLCEGKSMGSLRKSHCFKSVLNEPYYS